MKRKYGFTLQLVTFHLKIGPFLRFYKSWGRCDGNIAMQNNSFFFFFFFCKNRDPLDLKQGIFKFSKVGPFHGSGRTFE